MFKRGVVFNIDFFFGYVIIVVVRYDIDVNLMRIFIVVVVIKY